MSTQTVNSANDHRIWYRLVDDVVFVVPEGAGNQACAEELEGIFEKMSTNGHRKFVLDLSHLKYFETPGFRLIVNKLCDLQKVGGSLVVTGLRGAIARAFNLLKLEGVVPIAEDARSAISIARRQDRRTESAA